jgi:hypothetical protein
MGVAGIARHVMRCRLSHEMSWVINALDEVAGNQITPGPGGY